MRRTHHVVTLLCLSTVVAGCEGDRTRITNVVPDVATVRMEDECDPASFNAALGAGTCTRQGTVTFAQFNAELAATQQVASWRFVPAAFTVRLGQPIAATNFGGEVHTFTRVAQFGGGVVPELNQASGNLVMAPECAGLPASANVAPGGTFTTNAGTAIGTENYQCCIHPWMRSTVAVAAR